MSRVDPALRMRWSVDAAPHAVAGLRRSAEDVLTGWQCPEAAVCSAVLVLSELVTNAVVHASRPGGPVVVRVAVRPRDCIRVEVGDQSAVMPKPAASDDQDEHGRGQCWSSPSAAAGASR
jgi:anti-sigma regulatory factor (Ser/Thr protein kinase)